MIGQHYLEKDSPLACEQCHNGILNCECPDIDERLALLEKTMPFRKCRECGKHYARCECAHPFWIYSHTGAPMDEANRLQALEEAQ